MKILNKNGLPYSIHVLFAPVVILPNSKKSLKSSYIGKIMMMSPTQPHIISIGRALFTNLQQRPLKLDRLMTLTGHNLFNL